MSTSTTMLSDLSDQPILPSEKFAPASLLPSEKENVAPQQALPQVSLPIPQKQVAVLNLPQQPEFNENDEKNDEGGKPVVVKTLTTMLKPPMKRVRKAAAKAPMKRVRKAAAKKGAKGKKTAPRRERAMKVKVLEGEKGTEGEAADGEEPKKRRGRPPFGSMKGGKQSVIAVGKKARNAVFRGAKKRTASGLKKEQMAKNRHGKIVSIKASEAAKKKFLGNNGISVYVRAVKEARQLLGLTGFQPVGGKSEAGQKLLQKARSIYKRERALQQGESASKTEGAAEAENKELV